MTNKEILEKAIQKAIDGGWREYWTGNFHDIRYEVGTGEMFIIFRGNNLPEWKFSLFGLIFHQGFAKALWGEEPFTEYYPSRVVKLAFVHHLQQMVISKDPIKYLGENI